MLDPLPIVIVPLVDPPTAILLVADPESKLSAYTVVQGFDVLPKLVLGVLTIGVFTETKFVLGVPTWSKILPLAVPLTPELIDIASKSGADYVKFQTFKVDQLILKNTKTAAYQKRNLKHNIS